MNEQYDEWEKNSSQWRNRLDKALKKNGGTDIVTQGWVPFTMKRNSPPDVENCLNKIPLYYDPSLLCTYCYMLLIFLAAWHV